MSRYPVVGAGPAAHSSRSKLQSFSEGELRLCGRAARQQHWSSKVGPTDCLDLVQYCCATCLLLSLYGRSVDRSICGSRQVPSQILRFASLWTLNSSGFKPAELELGARRVWPRLRPDRLRQGHLVYLRPTQPGGYRVTESKTRLNRESDEQERG